jgi:hypothetical protein
VEVYGSWGRPCLYVFVTKAIPFLINHAS